MINVLNLDFSHNTHVLKLVSFGYLLCSIITLVTNVRDITFIRCFWAFTRKMIAWWFHFTLRGTYKYVKNTNKKQNHLWTAINHYVICPLHHALTWVTSSLYIAQNIPLERSVIFTLTQQNSCALRWTVLYIVVVHACLSAVWWMNMYCDLTRRFRGIFYK